FSPREKGLGDRAAASKLLLITTKVKKQRKTQHFSFDLFSKPQSDRQNFVNKQALMRLFLHLLRMRCSY
ncbi:MAG: hypothetical protein ACYTX0_36885, partial [Nostoc sp.]